MESTATNCSGCNTAMVRVVPCGGDDAREGRAVLIYGSQMDRYSKYFPDYVCVTCEPRWLELSCLCQQIETLDITKEHQCASQNFAAAAAARDAADLIRPSLQQLAMGLLPSGTR